MMIQNKHHVLDKMAKTCLFPSKKPAEVDFFTLKSPFSSIKVKEIFYCRKIEASEKVLQFEGPNR